MSYVDRGELRTHWRLLLAATLGLICGYGTLPVYTFGVFVQPLTVSLGTSASQLQLNMLVLFLTGAFASPFVGGLVDRFGPRSVATFGLFGMAIGMVVLATVQSLKAFYLGFALIAVLGAGTAPTTWVRALSVSFVERRGLALGICLSGTGICSIIAPQYAAFITSRFGWRMAYIGLALIPLVVAVIALRWVPHRTSATKSLSSVQPHDEAPLAGLTVKATLRNYRFWVMMVSIAVLYLAVVGITTNLVSVFEERGFGVQIAASALMPYGVMIIVARIGVGALIDRFWAPAVAFGALLPSAVGCILLAGTSSLPVMMFAAAIIGIGVGAELDILGYLAARYFGVAHLGAVYGLLYTMVATGAGLGPFLFAYLKEMSNSFGPSLLIAAAAFLFGGAILLTLGRYPREFDKPLKLP